MWTIDGLHPFYTRIASSPRMDSVTHLEGFGLITHHPPTYTVQLPCPQLKAARFTGAHDSRASDHNGRLGRGVHLGGMLNLGRLGLLLGGLAEQDDLLKDIRRARLGQERVPQSNAMTRLECKL